ncbi:sensor histidine kinase [Rhodococcus chondri]|uniref:histidine kinase n=1 Tax=Rhodococcus chondri TaxID=3065941 RepID=A0ABU7JPN1_9NOCA|nr:HAMP domain-containing sensor histidine kinase [Rhodococcus sp. CC-R104]MEE2031993.1 HAMP domain-containing sensor histidine kinase [Rhodococcus sp. CC-R104]
MNLGRLRLSVPSLTTRLFASHLLVAVVGALVTFAVVRFTAPALFEERAAGPGGARHRANVSSPLREVMADAVTTALLLGVLAGVVTAAALGVLASRRLLRSLRSVRSGTRAIATGDYRHRIPLPPEAELAAVASDVNDLAVRLADTEARRVRLLAEVAHEMRTPLTVIDGYAEGVLDGVFAPAELVQIETEVGRLRRLADDLSTLSRAEEGRLDLHPADVDLSDLAVQVADRLRPQFDDAGLTVTVHPPPRPVVVWADADRITQVLTNLLGNALAATETGGVSIDITAGRDTATVTVTDTGEGLDPDDVERVFERFYRVPSRRRGEHDLGSGIGLTISRRIARAHGGDLSAGSPGRGHGARFILQLPTRRDHLLRR